MMERNLLYTVFLLILYLLAPVFGSSKGKVCIHRLNGAIVWVCSRGMIRGLTSRYGSVEADA
jgi:hypothetical protein